MNDTMELYSKAIGALREAIKERLTSLFEAGATSIIFVDEVEVLYITATNNVILKSITKEFNFECQHNQDSDYSPEPIEFTLEEFNGTELYEIALALEEKRFTITS